MRKRVRRSVPRDARPSRRNGLSDMANNLGSAYLCHKRGDCTAAPANVFERNSGRNDRAELGPHLEDSSFTERRQRLLGRCRTGMPCRRTRIPTADAGRSCDDPIPPIRSRRRWWANTMHPDSVHVQRRRRAHLDFDASSIYGRGRQHASLHTLRDHLRFPCKLKEQCQRWDSLREGRFETRKLHSFHTRGQSLRRRNWTRLGANRRGRTQVL